VAKPALKTCEEIDKLESDAEPGDALGDVAPLREQIDVRELIS
jgi:hypothetical protein